MEKSEIDCLGTEEVICPWCGYRHEYEYDFSTAGDYICDECGKPFHLDVNWDPTFYSERIWSTSESPCGLIAIGQTSKWRHSWVAYMDWLELALKHWQSQGEYETPTFRASTVGTFEWTVFPWEEAGKEIGINE